MFVSVTWDCHSNPPQRNRVCTILHGCQMKKSCWNYGFIKPNSLFYFYFYALSRIDKLSVCFIPQALLDSVGCTNNPGALELTVYIWPLGQNCEESICALRSLCSLPFLPSDRVSWRPRWRSLPFFREVPLSSD